MRYFPGLPVAWKSKNIYKRVKLTPWTTFCDNNFNEVLALAIGKRQANARYTNTK
jgi:hypothetical protein